MHAPNKFALFTFLGLLGKFLSLFTMDVAMKSSESVLELADFPDEIVLKVFSNLDLKNLMNCSKVSKRFRTIAYDKNL